MKLAKNCVHTAPNFNTYTGLEVRLETEKDRSRQDVINKTMLRMMRRFYHRLFLKDNKHITKQRYRNVEFPIVIDSCREMVEKYLKIDAYEDLAIFLLHFIGIKCK
jgi:hypothetical protein